MGRGVVKYYASTSNSLGSFDSGLEAEASSWRPNDCITMHIRHPLTYISAIGHVTEALKGAIRVDRE